MLSDFGVESRAREAARASKINEQHAMLDEQRAERAKHASSSSFSTLPPSLARLRSGHRIPSDYAAPDLVVDVGGGGVTAHGISGRPSIIAPSFDFDAAAYPYSSAPHPDGAGFYRYSTPSATSPPTASSSSYMATSTLTPGKSSFARVRSDVTRGSAGGTAAEEEARRKAKNQFELIADLEEQIAAKDAIREAERMRKYREDCEELRRLGLPVPPPPPPPPSASMRGGGHRGGAAGGRGGGGGGLADSSSPPTWHTPHGAQRPPSFQMPATAMSSTSGMHGHNNNMSSSSAAAASGFPFTPSFSTTSSSSSSYHREGGETAPSDASNLRAMLSGVDAQLEELTLALEDKAAPTAGGPPLSPKTAGLSVVELTSKVRGLLRKQWHLRAALDSAGADAETPSTGGMANGRVGDPLGPQPYRQNATASSSGSGSPLSLLAAERMRLAMQRKEATRAGGAAVGSENAYASAAVSSFSHPSSSQHDVYHEADDGDEGSGGGLVGIARLRQAIYEENEGGRGGEAEAVLDDQRGKKRGAGGGSSSVKGGGLGSGSRHASSLSEAGGMSVIEFQHGGLQYAPSSDAGSVTSKREKSASASNRKKNAAPPPPPVVKTTAAFKSSVEGKEAAARRRALGEAKQRGDAERRQLSADSRRLYREANKGALKAQLAAELDGGGGGGGGSMPSFSNNRSWIDESKGGIMPSSPSAHSGFDHHLLGLASAAVEGSSFFRKGGVHEPAVVSYPSSSSSSSSSSYVAYDSHTAHPSSPSYAPHGKHHQSSVPQSHSPSSPSSASSSGELRASSMLVPLPPSSGGGGAAPLSVSSGSQEIRRLQQERFPDAYEKRSGIPALHSSGVGTSGGVSGGGGGISSNSSSNSFQQPSRSRSTSQSRGRGAGGLHSVHEHVAR